MICGFDVLSLNTAGIGDNLKRQKIFNYLKKSCSSKGIVLPQETHSTARNEAMRTNQWGCALAFWPLNMEDFSTVLYGMFSQVPTVARGKYMTNHIKDEQFLYDRSQKDQDRERV